MTETISGGDDSTDAVGSAGPTDMSELVGWQPDFPPGPQRAVSDGLTVGMTDDEILALYREKTNNPYLSIARRPTTRTSLSRRPTHYARAT
jgi:hypothetical protein